LQTLAALLGAEDVALREIPEGMENAETIIEQRPGKKHLRAEDDGHRNRKAVRANRDRPLPLPLENRSQRRIVFFQRNACRFGQDYDHPVTQIMANPRQAPLR